MTLPKSWQVAVGQEFSKPYFQNLIQFVDKERLAFPSQIYPPENQVFAALNFTALEKVRAVILGQDPYPGEGMAHGLCFSVAPTVKVLPASLRNIFRELQNDLGLPLPNNGCLTPWANQGVLLLNAILTVRTGMPLSHKGRGWETFTEQIIRKINMETERVVFVLWGKTAQQSLKLIDTQRHVVVAGAHPSPLSAKKFFGTRPFSTINTALRVAGKTEIDWGIPNL